MSNHTTTPWKVTLKLDSTLLVETADGKFNICVMCEDDDGGHLLDAIFIVKSVNHHDELVAALKRLHKALTWSCAADRMSPGEMEDLIGGTLEKIGESK